MKWGGEKWKMGLFCNKMENGGICKKVENGDVL